MSAPKAKTRNIIYWIVTIWLSLGMISTGIVQLIKMKEEVEMMEYLGYPVYLLSIIGVWKILGVTAILVRGYPLLKEWAYAGFFFVMSGAVISHIQMGDPVISLFGPVLLLVLNFLSWYFRPTARTLYDHTSR